MVSFSPPLTSPHQPQVISEAPCPVLPDVSQDIALSRVRVPAKKLMLDFAPSPNQYKATASRKNTKGRRPRSKQNPRQVLSLSLQCETVQAQDPEME
jgi:hypothetical protein